MSKEEPIPIETIDFEKAYQYVDRLNAVKLSYGRFDVEENTDDLIYSLEYIQEIFSQEVQAYITAYTPATSAPVYKDECRILCPEHMSPKDWREYKGEYLLPNWENSFLGTADMNLANLAFSMLYEWKKMTGFPLSEDISTDPENLMRLNELKNNIHTLKNEVEKPDVWDWAIKRKFLSLFIVETEEDEIALNKATNSEAKNYYKESIWKSLIKISDVASFLMFKPLKIDVKERFSKEQEEKTFNIEVTVKKRPNNEVYNDSWFDPEDFIEFLKERFVLEKDAEYGLDPYNKHSGQHIIGIKLLNEN